MVCPALNVCRVGEWPGCWGHYSLYAGLVEGLIQQMMSVREEVGSGLVERFQLVARPYEVKTQNEGVQGY
jgi:hypothetical protein